MNQNAASAYRSQREKQVENEPLYNVEVPSGFTFICRKLSKNIFISFGQLPFSMAEKAIDAMKVGDETEPQEKAELSPEEIQQSIEFARAAIMYICVSPKVSLNPKGANELSPLEISEEDFNHLLQWSMQSLGGGAVLNSFRQQSEQAVGNSSNGKKLRAKSR